MTACGSSKEDEGGAAAKTAPSVTIEGVKLERDDALHAALPPEIRDAGRVALRWRT